MNPSNDQYSIPVRPLLLNYSQLHRSNQQLVKHRASQHRLSIDKLSSISTNTSKCSFTSSPSMTSTPLPSLNEEVHLPTNNLVRLRTPQLRLLNISDKYINEAKELYFDATSRVFVPRAVAMQTMQVSWKHYHDSNKFQLFSTVFTLYKIIIVILSYVTRRNIVSINVIYVHSLLNEILDLLTRFYRLLLA